MSTIRVLSILVASLVLSLGCTPTAAPAPTSAPAVSAPPTTKPAAAPSPSAAASVSPSPSAASAAAPTVQLTDALKFDPPTLTVARGTTVTWRNASQLVHTVTDDPSRASNPADAQLPSGAQPWDSGDLNAGQTFTHTFDVAGTYKYFCAPHETAGMVATIVVTP